MNRIAMLLMCLVVCASALATKTVKEEQLIQKHLDGFATAWNNHDTKTMAGFWAEDGTVVNPAGRWAKGRTEVQQLFTDEHNTMMKGSNITWGTLTFRWVKPDVTFVDAQCTVTGAKTPDGKDMEGRHHVSLLMVKKSNRWWNLDVRPYVYVKPPPGTETALKN